MKDRDNFDFTTPENQIVIKAAGLTDKGKRREK